MRRIRTSNSQKTYKWGRASSVKKRQRFLRFSLLSMTTTLSKLARSLFNCSWALLSCRRRQKPLPSVTATPHQQSLTQPSHINITPKVDDDEAHTARSLHHAHRFSTRQHAHNSHLQQHEKWFTTTLKVTYNNIESAHKPNETEPETQPEAHSAPKKQTV